MIYSAGGVSEHCYTLLNAESLSHSLLLFIYFVTIDLVYYT